MPARRCPLPVAADVALTPAWLEDNAHAASTRTAYAAAAEQYDAWCRSSGLRPWQAGPMGADVIRAYQGALAQAGVAASTLRQRLAGVSWAYRRWHRVEPPTSDVSVRLSGRGAFRFAAAGRPMRRAAPLTPDQVARVLHDAPPTPDWLRTKALLSVMVCGALREGEAIGLHVEHLVSLDGGGYRAWLTSHKAGRDGTGATQVVRAPHWAPGWDPTPHVERWIAWAKIDGGPLFRGVSGGARATRVNAAALSVRSVDRAMHMVARWLGIDVHRVSGHTPRCSWVCSALAAGLRPEIARRHTRHATVEMLLEYQRVFVGVTPVRETKCRRV